jgi:hypothetical protein
MKKKNVLMTAIAIFGLATITMAQSVPSYVPTNGLVGWWPFNGNANDESGNGNNGTVTGAVLTSDKLGNMNSAYHFDGIGDNIFITNSFFDNGWPNWTISIWYNLDQIQNPNNGNSSHILFNTEPHTGLAMDLNWGSSNKYSIFLGNGTPSSSWNSLFNNSSAQNISLNSWENVVLQKTSNSYSLFINGVLDTIWTSPTSISSYLYKMYFGACVPSISNEVIIGSIDDIGIWDRALSQQEITDLFNGCQLTVNTQPNSQTININNTAQFIVGSSDPIATFQWQTDLGVGFQNLNSVGQYSGTTNDTLNVSNVTMSNNNQPFRCIISSGSCSDTSNVAVLTVNNTVGINEFKQDNLFSVYPNPAKSQINVKADAKLLGSVYTVYDNTGKVVLSGKIISDNTVIELGNLSGGIYLFSVGENMKQTFKVIKE